MIAAMSYFGPLLHHARGWFPATEDVLRLDITLTSSANPPKQYSTIPRNGNPANGKYLDICLLSSRKNGNSLTWVLVALKVYFTYPVLYRVSSESRAGEWEL